MKNPFDQCSQEYERFRPAYPPEMIDRLVSHCGLGADSRILDVGAGPGKGSLPLIERGFDVVLAEPSLSMIREGVQSYPRLRYVCSTAEALPFSARRFDLVTSAQSFHWFNPAEAVPELARVLKPQRFLAVYWNNRDTQYEHTAFFESLIERFNPSFDRRYRTKDWTRVLEEGGRFRLAYHAEYRFSVQMNVEDWVGLARSISYVRKIGDERMLEFEAELRNGMSRWMNVDCPYVTEIWVAVSRA